jgi:biopolymer transport protein ExbD
MSAIHPPEYQQSPPQPPPLPPHRSWPRRHKILTALGSGFGLLVVLIIVIVATSAPSVTKPSAPATTAAAPATSAPATPTAPSVSQQMTAWFNGGGSAQLKAIATDSGTIQTDIQAYVASDLTDGTTLQADDATFQSDVQAAQANLPPAGVPGFRSDHNAALTYYNASATDLNNAVITANSGDYNGAIADIEAGHTAQNNGNAKLNAATGDISTST